MEDTDPMMEQDSEYTKSSVPKQKSKTGTFAAFIESISSYGVALLILVILVACVVLAFLGYIFYLFQHYVAHNLSNYSGSNYETSLIVTTGTRTIPTYLALFIFAEIFHIILTFEALWGKNVIELIGLCFFTGAKVVDAALQYVQLYNVVVNLLDNSEVTTGWDKMKGFVIAIPAIEGAELLIQIYLTIRLYREFGWAIYRNVGANIRLKRRYFVYLVFATLLKFDFFFFLGFTIQFLVVGKNISAAETGLTAAVIPLTIVFIYLVLFAVKKEYKWLMTVLLIVFLCGLAYFAFKLVRIWQPGHELNYIAARKTLTLFAAITIVLLVASLVNAIMCMMNMDHGLKAVIDKDSTGLMRHPLQDEEAEHYPMHQPENKTELSDHQPIPNRMTIE